MRFKAFHLSHRGWLLGAAVLAVLSVAACSDKLDSGASCPLLCPQQAITLRDTFVDAVIEDTTIVGLPPIGQEDYLMLSSHGDTLETRAIIRYDTLPQTYTTAAANEDEITEVDSAYLIMPVALLDSTKKPTTPVTIEAYDVNVSDSTASDTAAAVLAPLFRPDRLLGSATYQPDSLADTLRLPLSTDSVKFAIDSGRKFRVGLRIVASKGIDLRIGTTQNSLPVTLRIKATLDTTATPVDVTPVSNTPTTEPFLASALSDFTVVIKGTTGNSPTIIGVGGVPSRRAIMHFIVPSHIVDSTTIVRAALDLTQTPNRKVDVGDSVWVYPQAVLASPTVGDPRSQLQFIGSTGQFGMDSLLLSPGDSGLREFQIAGLARTWRNESLSVSPRTLALRSGSEGQVPAEIDFFSTKAPAAVRPRLRITYVPRTSYGVP